MPSTTYDSDGKYNTNESYLYHDCQYEGPAADVSSWKTFVNLVSGNRHEDCLELFWWKLVDLLMNRWSNSGGLCPSLACSEYLLIWDAPQIVMQDKIEFEEETLTLALLWPDFGLEIIQWRRVNERKQWKLMEVIQAESLQLNY